MLNGNLREKQGNLFGLNFSEQEIDTSVQPQLNICLMWLIYHSVGWIMSNLT